VAAVDLCGDARPIAPLVVAGAVDARGGAAVVVFTTIREAIDEYEIQDRVAPIPYPRRRHRCVVPGARRGRARNWVDLVVHLVGRELLRGVGPPVGAIDDELVLNGAPQRYIEGRSPNTGAVLRHLHAALPGAGAEVSTQFDVHLPLVGKGKL